MSNKLRGHCLCKSVQFEVAPPVENCSHCHCESCRRSSGASFVTWTSFARTQLSIVDGDKLIRKNESSKGNFRSFCQNCGTPLFAEMEDDKTTVYIPTATFDEKIGINPTRHVSFEEKVCWLDIKDDLPKFYGKEDELGTSNIEIYARKPIPKDNFKNGILEGWNSVSFNEIIELYKAVGWTNYTEDKESLKLAFQNSNFIMLFMKDGLVVGLTRSISDDVSIHYLQDILVHPKFQKQGIGRKLLTKTLERYSHVRTQMLLTDDEEKQKLFYESLGYKQTKGLKKIILNSFVKMKGVDLI